MKRRKHRYRGYSKRTIILTIALFCSLFFGLGYSLLGTSLDLSGGVSISKYDDTLYGVLAREGRKGIYAREYTDAHQDSMDPTLSTEKIYHWYASNDSKALEILEKNNVLFAGHCWQMFRTTDTGGVKLIYNGEASSSGQCTSSRNNQIGYSTPSTTTLSNNYYYGSQYYYDSANDVFSLKGIINTGEIKEGYFTCKSESAFGTCSDLYLVSKQTSGTTYYVVRLIKNSPYYQFGETAYNEKSNSLSYVGYMYNKVYPRMEKKMQLTDKLLDKSYLSFSNSYYYGTGVNYSDGKYTLVNPVKDTWTNISSSSMYHYTCKSSYYDYCSEVEYIYDGEDNYIYGFKMTGGNLLNDYNIINNLGTDVIDNNDGTYTLVNTTTVYNTDWYTDYNNYKSYFLCPDGSLTCTIPRYILSTTNNNYTYEDVYDVIYSNGFTYSDGKYYLDSNRVVFWDITNNDFKNSLKSHHYTCFNSEGVCDNIKYIYSSSSIYDYSYIELSNGENISDAINNSLNSRDVNQKNSLIKTCAESWYQQFLISYGDYLEDSIMCNNREISSLGGWEPNNGSVTSYLYYKQSFLCSNETDRFSINNSVAKLTYPIGLITNHEAWMLASVNGDSLLRKTGNSYWTMTPDDVGSSTFYFRAISDSGGTNFSTYVGAWNGNRWVVSLKPGTKYLYGDGSTYHPYVIDNIQNTTFTIYYRLSDGSEAAPSYVGIYKPGEPFSIPSPTIENYITRTSVVSGTKAPGNQSVTVWYTYNGGSIIDPDTPLDP